MKAIDPSLTERIKSEEGFRGLPYDDHLGKPTIGFGTLLPITEAEGELLLRSRLRGLLVELRGALPWYASQPEPVRRVLGDLAYNLGVPRLLDFKRMLAALEIGDYPTAAKELMDSRYARQVPARAERNAIILRGQWRG